MPKLHIPATLIKYTQYEDKIDVKSTTIDELLTELKKRYPELAKYCFDQQGKLTGFLNFYINDQDIRQMSWTETNIKKNDIIKIIPSLAGG